VWLVVSGLLFLFAVLPVSLSAQPSELLFELSVRKHLMGTIVDATIRHPDIDAGKRALYEAFHEMGRVEDLLSSHKPGSEISKINRGAGARPVNVSRETFEAVRRAKDYATRFQGLFDISIGPLTSLWGFSDDAPVTLPDSAAIAARRLLVDYRRIMLDERDTTVYLPERGMRLDLGGVAKGYAIDRGAAILEKDGVRHFLINAGGDVYAGGEKDVNTPWRLGVKHPRKTDALLARFDLGNYAVATSGDYERFVIINGKRYHHILDPRTGYPAAHSQSVTVLAPTAEEADALATYVFVLGYTQVLKTPLASQPFLIVDAGGNVHYSKAFKQLPGFEVIE